VTSFAPWRGRVVGDGGRAHAGTMNVTSPPLQRAQQLFEADGSTTLVIDELQDEFGIDPGTAIAAAATVLLIPPQIAAAVDQPMVRPYVTATFSEGGL